MNVTGSDLLAKPRALWETEAASLRAENGELRAQLALRDHALDATPTFFVITHLAGAESSIVYCNDIVANLYGLSRTEVIGEPLERLTRWAGLDAEDLAEAYAALRAGQTFRFEDEVSRRDGSRFWIGVSIRPLFDASGRLTHSVAIGADITAKREEALKKQELQDKLVTEMKERERITLELQLAQKLESVGRLAAGMAHEINTPIQYVGDSAGFLRSATADLMGMFDGWHRAIDLLPEDPGTGQPGASDPGAGQPAAAALRSTLAALEREIDVDYLRAEIPKAFESMFEGLQRVSKIVNALKEFSDPDAKEQGPADLNHALETTLLVASNEYKYLAKVSTEFEAIPQVVCNVGELNQVFLHLIVNAAHAIQDGGKDAATGKITIHTALSGTSAVIRIRDNGCGVPAENLSKLYDPFFTTKEVGRGSGQGLAICRSIVVDKHGGDITVRSTEDIGTEFTIRLPVAGRKELRRPPDPAP